MKRILIVGAGGQIGSELTPYLRSIYGAANVVATMCANARLWRRRDLLRCSMR